MAGGDDAFGNRGDLLGSLAGAENHLGKPLADAAVVVDPGEPKVLEGGLAQKLKESVLRSLRRKGAAANLFEEGPELVARHAVRKRSRASKSLTRVDFQFC